MFHGKNRKLKIKPSRSCSGKPEIQPISNKPSCIGKRFTYSRYGNQTEPRRRDTEYRFYQKIHKDTTQKLNISDQIAVLESDGTDVQLNGKPIPQDYYKKMEVGNSHRLYIRPSTSGNNYMLTNDFLSKYPTAKVAHEELLNQNGQSGKSSYEELYYTIYDNMYKK
ncbi:hypothetical protein [Listeria booriae]|uniref:Uncharacterized protein n=1 Tax=Listeria booriae TaxID=1552123 RepID=A0A842F9N7_9LIST|nr:hypothetical protein [Listeria booriae]MBC2241389.1 hypothetical protein [Listeria booriae]